jgi:hypothetical protein
MLGENTLPFLARRISVVDKRVAILFSLEKEENVLQDKQAYIGPDFSPNTKNETRAPE